MFPSRLPAVAPLAVVFAVLVSGAAPSAPAGPSPSLFEELPWDPLGATPYSHFGIAVAPAGDVDNDGDGDVLVGAPGAGDDPHFNAGRVFLYKGSPQGLADAPSWSWSPPQVDAYAGSALAPAGDVNGDGYHDVIVGVPGWNTGGAFGAGRVVLFHGGPTGLPAAPSRDLLPPT